MAEVMIWSPVERLLWGVAITIFFIGFILYVKKGIEKENVKEKILMFGYAGLILGLILSMITNFLASLFLEGTYKNHAFYGDLNEVNLIYVFLFTLSMASFYTGIMLFILAYEINFKNTKYFFSIFCSVLILIMIIMRIFSYILYLILTTFLMIFEGTVMLIILIKYTRVSQLEYKAVSSYTVLGASLAGYGVVLSSSVIKILDVIPIWIPPLLFCIGGVFMIFPLFTSSKNFRRTFKFWKFMGFFAILLFAIFTIIYIINDFPIHYIITTVYYMLFILYVVYTVLKDLKNYTLGAVVSDKVYFQTNILGAFARPQKLTEEEVSISKEKKICLVCKGKVLGHNVFICPECETFYCSKCSEALSNLENACWVCNEPFDESKPVKPFKKEEEIDIEISEKPQKKLQTPKN